MSNAKKFANKGFEETATATTRSTSKHGVGATVRRIKRKRNRTALRKDAAEHFANQ
jgi:hypothetical protein